MSKLSEEQIQEFETVFNAILTIEPENEFAIKILKVLETVFGTIGFENKEKVTKEKLKAYLSTPGKSVDDAVIYENIKIADENGDF